MIMVIVMMMMMAMMMPTCMSSDEVQHPWGHDRQVANDHGDMIGIH